MCGRATLVSGIKNVEKLFGLRFENEVASSWNNFFPNYNLAPTHYLPALVKDEDKSLVLLRWGLVPFWAKDVKIGYKMINARAETIREKPAYKNSFRRRRCIVAIDGYYEWQGKEKLPWRIGKADKAPFGVAAIWEEKQEVDGSLLRTVSLITRPAVKELEQIHDRMPLALLSSTFDHWLNEPFSSENDWNKFIDTAILPLNKVYRVSKRVNSVRNNDAGCISPDDNGEQLSLF
ncbi:MAG: SOS response-associated peptidase [Saprospirales bacterium]|nr:MAG: SOS response-associated peptidase [Saprospirales bacterium]